MLNDLNDLILNMKKKEEFGELEDFSGMGSVDNDDIFEMEPLPRTSSMLESEERESIRRVDDNRQVNISGFKVSPFDQQQRNQEGEGLRNKDVKM